MQGVPWAKYTVKGSSCSGTLLETCAVFIWTGPRSRFLPGAYGRQLVQDRSPLLKGPGWQKDPLCTLAPLEGPARYSQTSVAISWHRRRPSAPPHLCPNISLQFLPAARSVDLRWALAPPVWFYMAITHAQHRKAWLSGEQRVSDVLETDLLMYSSPQRLDWDWMGGMQGISSQDFTVSDTLDGSIWRSEKYATSKGTGLDPNMIFQHK